MQACGYGGRQRKNPFAESPLLGVGQHFLPRATLIFCVDVVPAPRYSPAVARLGSGGL